MYYKRSIIKILFGVGFIFLMGSCTLTVTNEIDNSDVPLPPEVPSIEFISLSTTEVTQYIDSIQFSIKYTDGDGDLGTTDPDATVIELIDNRDPNLLIFNYHLSPRAPAGTSIAIEGTLDIVLDNTILLDQNNSSETTSFSIRIVDREEQWSNTIESPQVTIKK